MSVYVGLDCGGSSSRVMAIDGGGAILYQGQSGAANILTTPEPRLRRNLAQAVQDCPTPSYVCGCFAGLINGETNAHAVRVLSQLFPSAEVRAEPDYTAAFFACAPGTDVCIIAGTGSLVCSFVNGRMVKSGGGGYLLGDEGSAFQFGRDALRHYLRQPQSASPSLREAIVAAFRTDDPPQIVSQIHNSGTPATFIAKFAKVLGADARSKESYALASLDRHLGDLLELLKSHVDMYLPHQERLNLTLAGGLWKGTVAFRERFAELAPAYLEGRTFELSRIARPPLYGAVELAKQMHHGNGI